MLESPAHRALSLAALRVLFRIEVEHANHAGNDNGKLPVTYVQFEEWGVRPDSIASALREVEALGFVKVTLRGHGGSARTRTPNFFRLTYRPSRRLDRTKGERDDSTNDWRKILTRKEAMSLASKARQNADNLHVARGKRLQRRNSKS